MVTGGYNKNFFFVVVLPDIESDCDDPSVHASYVPVAADDMEVFSSDVTAALADVEVSTSDVTVTPACAYDVEVFISDVDATRTTDAVGNSGINKRSTKRMRLQNIPSAVHIRKFLMLLEILE
jgi:hypothetical protein